MKKIYLSAIHQDTGKTTISLGLYKIFKEMKLKPAFIKPVGQQYVDVGKHHIDKDSYLIKQIFHCHEKIKDMSPITVARGFTEEYILHPDKKVLERGILNSFKNIKKKRNIVIIEGTGHAGVGSVFDFSNADVASLIKSKVIIISGGGIGRSIDEIVLNKALFELNNVEILGVIVNKVLPGKYDKVKKFLSKGLKRKGIKLLGVVPYSPILTFPTVRQLAEQLNVEVICGNKNLDNRIEDTIVAAMEPQNTITYLKDNILVITSGDRIDNMLVAISSHLIRKRKGYRVAGILLTGGMLPHSTIVDLLKRSKIPVLFSKEDTYSVSSKVKSLTFKIEKNDKSKVNEATRLVKEYIDVDEILKNI